MFVGAKWLMQLIVINSVTEKLSLLLILMEFSENKKMVFRPLKFYRLLLSETDIHFQVTILNFVTIFVLQSPRVNLLLVRRK